MTPKPRKDLDEPLTQEQVEKLRTKGIKSDRDSELKSRFTQIGDVERLISYLSANRAQIAGFAIVCISYDDTVCVDPTSGSWANGISARSAATSNYGMIIAKKAERLTKLDETPSLADILEDMMNSQEQDQ